MQFACRLGNDGALASTARPENPETLRPMKPFHAHHPAFGAGASLLAGEDGADCVIQRMSKPDIALGLFVGVRQAPSLPWRMLPLFAQAPESKCEAFEVLTPGRYGRTFALASDRWLIGPLVFKLCTPWWTTRDPALCDRDTARLHFAPSIGGFVEYDNTHSEEPVDVLVGMAAPGAGLQPVAGSITGFHSASRFGFATPPASAIRTRLGATPFAEGAAGSGDCAALVFTVPAFSKRVFPLAAGFYNSDDDRLLHRSLFASLDDVLATALANNDSSIRRADEIDAGWFASAGTRDEKVARALAVRGHLAASSVTREGSAWKLTSPRGDGLEAFDAEVFPWVGSTRSHTNIL